MHTLLRRPRIPLRQYYALSSVRRRIREYCGLTGESGQGAMFLVARRGPDERWEDAPQYPPAGLDALLDQELDFTRSLWDQDSLTFFLDLDYWNPDQPDEAFTHPVETFFKLEPVHHEIRGMLRARGLPALALMTGQGYHYVGRIPLESSALGELADLSPDPPGWLASHLRRAPRWAPRAIDQREARAFVGLGMVMEHVAHETLRRAAPHSDVPLVVNATRVGAGPLGRECISLDLSAFSDPLDIRHARTAFSAYPFRLHPHEGARLDAGVALAPIAAIPRGRLSLPVALEVRADFVRAAERASEACTTLPNVDAGVSRLVREYRRSSLHGFHESFLAEPPDLDRAREDRRRIDGRIPRCIAACLEHPNDLLLRPEYLQNLTRWLLSLGWSARRIASLIQVVYEEDHGWGDRWDRMHAQTRAEVYVRGFAGLIAVGADRMVDFTCVSTQEKGLCPGGACGHELALDRGRLLERAR